MCGWFGAWERGGTSDVAAGRRGARSRRGRDHETWFVSVDGNGAF